MRPILLAMLCLSIVTACKEDDLAKGPAPVKMTPEALGHYCQMNLTEHPGPKAQIHLEGLPAPIYFAQVRDAIAYQKMPEQSHAISAFYVNDMAVAPSWEAPGDDNWIAASAVQFVVGSDMVGGMGAPEVVPFSSGSAAQAFADIHGGQVLELGQIADAHVLAPEESEPSAVDDQDFIDRLSRMSNERNG
ncbi:MAG: nitrous oxide reductase accessory protein NosL [Silicimonas sp.]